MIYDKSDTEELFTLLLSRYETGLEESEEGTEFILDCANLFHYKCHEINLKRGGSVMVISAFKTLQQLH